MRASPPQELLGVRTQDQLGGVARQPRVPDGLDGIRVAHVEGVVAAQQHVLGRRFADKEAQRGRRVGNRVEVEPGEGNRDRLAERLPDLGPDLPATDEPAEVVGQVAAAVGQADDELRVTLEDAAEIRLAPAIVVSSGFWIRFQ